MSKTVELARHLETPVSYTHLDVYKRQASISLRRYLQPNAQKTGKLPKSYRWCTTGWMPSEPMEVKNIEPWNGLTSSRYSGRSPK